MEKNEKPEMDAAIENYPKNVQKQMNQINTLKASVDLNYGKREAMKSMLDAKTSEAHKILESIPLRVKHSDKRDFLGMVVKNHVLELENNELNFNLKLQEKMNKILSTECQRLKKMMKNNNISLTEDDDDEGCMDSDDGSPDNANRYKNFPKKIGWRHEVIGMTESKRSKNQEAVT